MAPTKSLTTDQAAAKIAQPDEHWNGDNGDAATVEYGFIQNGFAFSGAQIVAATDVMQLWSDVARINFVMTTGPDLQFVNYRDPDGSDAAKWSEDTDSRIDQDVFGRSGTVGFNRANGWGTTGLGIGENNRRTLIHEIGHALGLAHPGDYNAGSKDDPPITWGNDAEYFEDTRQYSVMSYFSEKTLGADFGGASARTPLLHDIAAIQSMYGANYNTRIDPTVYGFHSTAGPTYLISNAAEKAVYCIWDAGGWDTLDFSGYTGTRNFLSYTQEINLNANTFSSVGGLRYNISIAQGVTIEAALGGGGTDKIYGNAVNNYLAGNGGDDQIFGGAGADTLSGGIGNDTLFGGEHNDTIYGDENDDTLNGEGGADTMYGGSGNDNYAVDDAGDQVIDVADTSGGLDKIFTTLSTYDLRAPNKGVGVEELQYTGTGNFGANGNTLDNYIVGAAGNDWLYGNEGQDTLAGGMGSDTLRGGDGNDLLKGEGGIDTMYGGTGDDTYIVNDEGDVVIESFDVRGGLKNGVFTPTVRGGNDTVESLANKYILQEAPVGIIGTDGMVENLIFTGTGAFFGQGNSANNFIKGGAESDRLYGWDGKDRLDGGAGADSLYGGAGDDTYVVDDVGDLVVETTGISRHDPGGIDTVETSRDYYELPTRVENLVYTGVAVASSRFDYAFTGIGNELSNVIKGGYRGDTLTGGGGDDTLTGGADADTLIFKDGWGNDTVTDFQFGGPDKLDMRGVTGLYSMHQMTATAEGDGTRIAFGKDSILLQHVAPGNLSATDFLFAEPKEKTIVGTEGPDTIPGTLAKDNVQALGGDDTMLGSAGPDALDGGAGTDTVSYEASSAAVSVNLTTGVGHGGDAEGDTYVGIEKAIGSMFDDTYQGGSNFSWFTGGEGNDTMTGGAFYDTLDGGKGNDTFIGTGGFMLMLGGEGNDTMIGSLDNANYFSGGAGDDIMTGGNSVDYMADVDGGDDIMHAGAGDDGLYDYNGGIAQMFGEGGNDNLIAANGSGVLEGGADNDQLTGYSGIYTLLGGDGNDTFMAAGTGSYTFTGGADADVFFYRIGMVNPVKVTDFEDGKDHIYLWDNFYYGNVPYESLKITDSADGAIISFNGGSQMIFAGITASQLTKDDFVFAI